MTPTPSANYRLFVGIDIAAATFTASWGTNNDLTGRPATFTQNLDGYTALQERLTLTHVAPAETLVVLEATGSYWVALAVNLHTAGYHVSVVNPAQVYHFARSLSRRAKTDQLDAQLLVQFAAVRQPARWSPPPQVYHELRQRLVARDALKDMRQHARNHRHALEQWPVIIASVREQLDSAIADLDQRIHQLDREIDQTLRNGKWSKPAELLTSITGIGTMTAAWLLVTTLNFSLCPSADAATAYAGLAPMVYQSGTSVRARAQLGHSGNGRLRKALYLATLAAARYNPVIKTFYDRLVTAGKPKKVARCAAARKLLHLAWAIGTKGESFDPAYAQRDGMQRAGSHQADS